MSIGKFFKKVGNGIANVGKTVVNTIAPAPLKIGMAVVNKLTGGGSAGDPEAARQAEEERKFNEEIAAQTAQIQAQTAQLQAENTQISGMLGTMRSESDDIFKAVMGDAPPMTGLPGDFEGKELFERYGGPQAFGASNPFGSPNPFGGPSGLPPEIAQALQQYGLDLNKLQMS